MRYCIAAMTLVMLASTPNLAEDLKRLSLDNASAVTPRIETDAKVKAEGRSSVKITTQWPTTVCLAEVAGLNVENAKLLYTARVKSELAGTAYLEMWAHIGGNAYYSRGMNSTITGAADWKAIHTPFTFQQGQKPDKVTLNLVINGKGTVWIDDIVLSKEPLK